MPPLSCGVFYSLHTSLALKKVRQKFHQKWTTSHYATTITHFKFKQEKRTDKKRTDIVLTFKIM